MAQSHRQATPLFELGDQDSPRFDDLARLRLATFEADWGKRFAAHAPGYRAAFRTLCCRPPIHFRRLPYYCRDAASCANTTPCFSRQRGPGPRM